ncbi:hypothetical protein PsorP6_001860 [Peronosclerospora sorghi]|uniref:Uncharacterized protein n=1 Tax=Peronosclerospora sorghi TaxID=230839 RepID=A0ACC0WR32_9STRA|nr:hypothetical protein PsorP6_001860 [Peronosclerospora sorghi]
MTSAPDLGALSSPHVTQPPRTSVRHLLSEKEEHEALSVLREKFRHEQRITSDDVRYVVRAIVSQGRATTLPSDFPPMAWILEFKRAHGFTPHGGRFIYGLPERLNCTRRQQHLRRALVVDDHRTRESWKQDDACGREDVSSDGTNGTNGDCESGAIIGTSCSSSAGASATSSTVSTDSSSKDGCASLEETAPPSSAKRGYKMSHTVPPETWEKAIEAVEQQGMSLRAAAKIYGVHFAALHRRVKKRAQEGQSSKGSNGYFHQSDETSIMRVVVARAELGVLMTFDELMNLVEAAALRKLPDISVENARTLMVRFQSRNEQSIRHLIVDWPPPVPALMSGCTSNHYHLEHPGYNYKTGCSPQTFVSDGLATATTVAPTASRFLSSPSPVDGKRPMLPSLDVKMNALRPSISQHHHQFPGVREHPEMLV